MRPPSRCSISAHSLGSCSPKGLAVLALSASVGGNLDEEAPPAVHAPHEAGCVGRCFAVAMDEFLLSKVEGPTVLLG